MGSKYGNKHTEIDGIRFDSLAEARRYKELKLMEKAGEIRDIAVHPRFDLQTIDDRSRRVTVARYEPDFWYYSLREHEQVFEDVKGVRTPVYRLKKKIFEAQYGVKLREIEA